MKTPEPTPTKKTLSEKLADDARAQEEARLTKLEENKRFVERVAVANIPIYVRDTPFPKEERETREMWRLQMREKILKNELSVADVLCDHCRTDLVFTQPGIVLTSYPPKIYIGCPGCGWTGTILK